MVAYRSKESMLPAGEDWNGGINKTETCGGFRVPFKKTDPENTHGDDLPQAERGVEIINVLI